MLLLPKFQYHQPVDLKEACEMLASMGLEARLLAGGTDLLVNMKKGVESPEHLVSIGELGELQGIHQDGDVLKIGACHRVADISSSQLIHENFPGIALGAESLGSPPVRNLATVGGNLVTASPAADLPPPLMAYGARVVLRASNSERTLELNSFFLGPGQTQIQPHEILSEIIIPIPLGASGCGYLKLGTRKALEISIVNVAAFISMDGNGLIDNARVVLGSVAPTPIRSHRAEMMLKGEKPSSKLFEEAGKAALIDTNPIDDFRASAAYRKEMVAVLTKRALAMAHEQIRVKS